MLLEIVFWACAGLILYTHAGYRPALGARPPARPAAETHRRRLPARSQPDRRRLRRGGRDRGEGGERPRPRLPAGQPRRFSSPPTAQATAPRAGLRRRRRPRPRPAAGGQARHPERRRRGCPRRGAGLLRRQQQTRGAGGSASPRRSLRRPCGEARWREAVFADPAGDNQEGLYWRYEMAVRGMESRLGGVTGGDWKDAMWPVRRLHWPGPAASHDLLPFRAGPSRLPLLLRAGGRAVEPMVPTGEFARKRRMMVGLWDIVVGERMACRAATGPFSPSSSPLTGFSAT